MVENESVPSEPPHAFILVENVDGLAERGQRRAEGHRRAGSDWDSIPMSIPADSDYIERQVETITRRLRSF